jgi:hypothetical protein
VSDADFLTACTMVPSRFVDFGTPTSTEKAVPLCF